MNKKSFFLLTFIIPVIISLLAFTMTVYAQPQTYPETGQTPSEDLFFKAATMISAGVAFGLSAIGAGMGISAAGSAALSASVERPEVRSLGIIICGLAESLAIYGLIVALQLIGKI